MIEALGAPTDQQRLNASADGTSVALQQAATTESQQWQVLTTPPLPEALPPARTFLDPVPTAGEGVNSRWASEVTNDLKFLVERPCFVAYQDAGQLISASRRHPTLVANQERFDTAGMHSTVSNTGRGTARVDGKYRCSATVQWAGAGQGVVFRLGFMQSGTTYHPATATTSAWHQASRVLELYAGQYVEVAVDLAQGPDATVKLVEFAMEFISR